MMRWLTSLQVDLNLFGCDACRDRPHAETANEMFDLLRLDGSQTFTDGI